MKKFITFLALVLLVGTSSLMAQTTFQIGLKTGIGIDIDNGPNPLDYINTINAFNLGVDLNEPMHVGFEAGILFKRFGFKTGVDLYKRNFTTIYYDENGDETGSSKMSVQYAQKSIPVVVNYLQPIGEKLFLDIGIGMSFDFTGSADNFRGSGFEPELEDDGRWELLSQNNDENYTNLFVVTDSGSRVYGRAYLGIQYAISENLNILARSTYFQTLGDSNISDIQIWGYDQELNQRAGGYFPKQLDYKTINFSIGALYSL